MTVKHQSEHCTGNAYWRTNHLQLTARVVNLQRKLHVTVHTAHRSKNGQIFSFTDFHQRTANEHERKAIIAAVELEKFKKSINVRSYHIAYLVFGKTPRKAVKYTQAGTRAGRQLVSPIGHFDFFRM